MLSNDFFYIENKKYEFNNIKNCENIILDLNNYVFKLYDIYNKLTCGIGDHLIPDYIKDEIEDGFMLNSRRELYRISLTKQINTLNFNIQAANYLIDKYKKQGENNEN